MNFNKKIVQLTEKVAQLVGHGKILDGLKQQNTFVEMNAYLYMLGYDYYGIKKPNGEWLKDSNDNEIRYTEKQFATEKSRSVPGSKVEQYRAAQSTPLGEGSYGIAYLGAEGGLAVIKISKAMGSAKKIEDFFNICKTQKDNPMFPIVYAFKINEDRSYWVLLERLYGIKGIYTREASNDFDKLFGLGLKIQNHSAPDELQVLSRQIARELYLEPNKFVFKSKNELPEGISNPNNPPNPEQIKNIYYLVDFIKTLRDKVGITPLEFDTHSENLGFRKNGQPVIFDPLVVD